jgi:hypothetical protein
LASAQELEQELAQVPGQVLVLELVPALAQVLASEAGLERIRPYTRSLPQLPGQ